MSKHKYKRSGQKPTKSLGDVTINDFANSTVPTNRAKKSYSNVSHVVKVEEKTWDENTEDFDGDFVAVEGDDGTTTYVIKKKKSPDSRKSASAGDKGVDYPIDIWFLISAHVRPEDVGRFAGICKSSYSVIRSYNFWFRLYKRHYVNVANIPQRLRPDCLSQAYGLRTVVVRTLYYTYPPFVARLKSITSAILKHPDCLTKRRCVLMWHRNHKDQWFYYFKLQENSAQQQRRVPEEFDLIELLGDVQANADENCKILKVTSKNFVPVPPVQGLTLTSINVTLSQGFLKERLQLRFGSGIQYGGGKTDGGGTTVVLDSADWRILDWWHPLYPQSRNFELLLNHD